MRDTTIRIFRLTAAGTSALHSARSVPDWYRSILRLVQADATSSEIIAGMTQHPGREVLKWIEQLETLGFVESLLVQRASNTGAAREASA
ncbi:MAG TPA: hypothetical protein VLF42_06560 [Burkholderiales bacterium]|nr:hypothetical protein [Burkholderiales bacterium]